MSVFELAGLEKLHRLVLVRVPKLTDNAIYYLGEHARSLERLHLSYCDRISLKALHHLLRHAPRLNHLTATGVPAARRMGLSRFSDRAPQVRGDFRFARPVLMRIVDNEWGSAVCVPGVQWEEHWSTLSLSRQGEAASRTRRGSQHSLCRATGRQARLILNINK